MSFLGLWGRGNWQLAVRAVTCIMPHREHGVGNSYAGLQHVILTKEEELALCRKLPDVKARDTLVRSNLRLVARIAGSFKHRGDLTIEDCIQWVCSA